MYKHLHIQTTEHATFSRLSSFQRQMERYLQINSADSNTLLHLTCVSVGNRFESQPEYGITWFFCGFIRILGFGMAESVHRLSYELDGLGLEPRQNVQTGSGAHSPSYSKVTGVLSQEKRGRGMKLTTPLHPSLWLSFYSLHMASWGWEWHLNLFRRLRKLRKAAPSWMSVRPSALNN